MTGFEGPGFSFWNILYTAVGASLFWSWWGRSRLRVFGLSNILVVFGVPGRWRARLEFVIFIVLGCLVGIGLVDPRSPVQALTAGLGWTGVFARPTGPGS